MSDHSAEHVILELERIRMEIVLLRTTKARSDLAKLTGNNESAEDDFSTDALNEITHSIAQLENEAHLLVDSLAGQIENAAGAAKTAEALSNVLLLTNPTDSEPHQTIVDVIAKVTRTRSA